MGSSQVSFYVGSSLAGIARTAVGFPLEHPIDSIKTQWQAQPHIKHEFAMIKRIYETKGIKGFYAGSISNFTRCVLKNSYKYPLMVGLPALYEKSLPDTFR